MSKISLSKILFAGIFILFLTTNFIVFTFLKSNGNKDTFENRNKTPFPTLIADNYKAYFTSIENYFSDNFQFKYDYISNIKYLRRKLFNFSNANKKVIYGKEGWMFLNACIYSDIKGMDEYCGLFPWTPKQAKHAVDNIETIKKFCEKNNILFIPIICPSKHTIYYDKLPPVYKKYQNNRYDELMIQSNGSLINYRELFIAQKAILPYPLYYKTDTHWNPLGAYFSVMDISKILNKKFPEIPSLTLNDITINKTISPVGLDLAKMEVINYDVEEDNVQINLTTKIPNKVHKAFIIHDSYYDYMKVELKQLFDVTEERELFKKPITAKEILDNKPDIFILEIVERYLDEINGDLDKGFYK